MVRSKITEPRILVVEDDACWRRELSMMYCRVLRGTSLVKKGLIAACRECLWFDSCFPSPTHPKLTDEAVDNLHDDVVPIGGGVEAIRLLRAQPNRFHILSLDLNLASQHAGPNRMGAIGLDVFDEALKSQDCIAVIVITGAVRDVELPTLLTGGESDRIATLQRELRDKLGGAYLWFDKWDESFRGDVSKQVRDIERALDKSELLNLIDVRMASLEQKGELVLCLYCCLPEDCFPQRNGRPLMNCIPFHRAFFPHLNQINLWQQILQDEHDFDVHADDMFLLLSRFPIVLRSERIDSFGKATSVFKCGKTRLEPRQQELLSRMAGRKITGTSSVTDDRSDETRNASNKKNASVLRNYLRNELGFPTNPIIARDGLYELEPPLSIFLCSESFLGIEMTPDRARS